MTRHIAHIIIEADAPLKVGSNASDFLQDSPIQKDWNALPMILGTSIAGVLRKDFDKSKVDDIFGKKNGSKVIISNALLLDEDANVNEELLLEKSHFLNLFDNLPIREHTAITSKGVAKEHSKFDEEIVYKGTRFKFSIEMIEDDKESFENILNLLSSTSFRLGGGSTKGFGKFKIQEIKIDSFDENSYKEYSSSLNHTLKDDFKNEKFDPTTHIRYILKIKPDDFFMFGSGFGDKDADMTPVYEKVIDYEKGCLSEEMILIPASSIKGAISHRTTFHYNKLQGNTIENGNGIEVVKEIFGEAKNSKEKIDGSKGKILISDCFKTNHQKIKTFDHVSIDRFTGGAIDGALFQEKTIAQDDTWDIEILLEENIEDKYKDSFEKALKEITIGMLPLGGLTTKGHGIFRGKALRDGVEI
ncbi:MAG: RAMP superfamily CRISPR-associated protein [Sulfurimonas sp.]|nr:RAMP superfamily CRISPR-associated protein [Sulfurimonas sp.]